MITLLFLAGGTGTRMGNATPKQYLPLNDKPIALYSFELFSSLREIDEIIVVCEPCYQSFFGNVLFALPGPRRQDSVYSGLLQSSGDLILTHDAARPFIEASYIPLLIEAAHRTGAAGLATPVTSTIKLCDAEKKIQQTIDRASLWEMQTPQAVRRDLLLQAFDHIHQHNLTATDELSMIEAIGHSAEVVACTPKNFKITTPFDLAVAHALQTHPSL